MKIVSHSLVFLLLLASSLGIGLSYEDGKNMNGIAFPQDICKDRFDIGYEITRCSDEYCTALCASKKYKRFYFERCWDSSSCECTYSCRSHRR